MVTIRQFLVMLGWVLASSLHAAEVTVSVVPDQPKMEESFRIVFSATEEPDDAPDFSSLSSLFEILRQNQNTQVQWVNGKHSRLTSWELEVVALRSGDVVIPAVSFGNDASPPTPITVLSAKSGITPPQSDLLLEIDVDDNTPYVQQQVILTVRLLRRVTLADAKLSDPETSADVIVKVLSKDRTYQDERLGKRYEVFERRFAVFAQSSGTLRIEPFTVTAQIPRSSRSLFDPFRSSTTTRRISSNAINLEVKPVPAAFSGATWLPAQNLSLREEWQPDGSAVTSGEPLTRTLFLWSEGLTAGQLPDFPTTKFGSANIYPDQIQTNEQETTDGFSALKQQKFAIISNSSETIEVPEIAIPWWNVETDKMEIARTAAKTINIAANPQQQGAVPAIPLESGNEPLPELPLAAPAAASAETPSQSGHDWRLIAIFALLGWFFTAAAWAVLRSRAARARTAKAEPVLRSDMRISRLEKEVTRAADANDPFACRNALIAWGNSLFKGKNLRSLGGLGKRVPAALAIEIRALDAHLYAQSSSHWAGENLKISFTNSDIKPPHESDPAANDNLESLFKLN